MLALAFFVSCAALRVRDQLSHAQGKPVVVVDQAAFDGENLNGRILISSDDSGYVVVDRRLPGYSILRVDDVLDCDGGATVHYIAADGYYFKPDPEVFLTIEPGYWFGRDFSLFMYAESIVHVPPPDCVEAILGVYFTAKGPSGDHGYIQLKVRAYLTPDAGTGLDAGTARPDAGQ